MLMQTDKPITVIPENIHLPIEMQPLKVAVYARVSTKQEEQYNSLETQIGAFTRIIENNSFWEFAGVYSETKSGKNTNKRTEFDRLLRDVKKGKVDLILTKSISRFSRNTLVTFEKLATLKEYGANIIFEKENIDFLNTSDSTHVAVMSAFAQAEIENLSDDIKWGLQQQAKDGNSKVINKKCYGYRNAKNGILTPHPTESKIVKLIFSLRAKGNSLNKIVDTLHKRKVPSPTGKEKWNPDSINKILHNEKYIGEVLYQKTYVEDLLEGKQVRNDRDVAMYHHTNHHEPIVSKKIFDMVQ